MDRFEHLGFLLQFGDKAEGNRLSQSSPFFANSDPEMPAVPVPVTQVHDWLMQNIASALEHISERTSAKENGPASAADQDVAMTDACSVSVKLSSSTRDSCSIEGITKSSYVKHASDIKGSSVKVCFQMSSFVMLTFYLFRFHVAESLAISYDLQMSELENLSRWQVERKFRMLIYPNHNYTIGFYII